MDIPVADQVEFVQGDVNLEGIDFITSGNQYLSFILGDEHYAVDILSVREIRGWESPTLIPNSPHYVKGVVNLRGLIVPILDLRLRFHVGEATYTPTTVVIVLTAEGGKGTRTIGYVVDAVSDVLNAEDEDIKQAPAFASTVPQNHIQGLLNAGDNVVTLLNIEAMQTLEEHS
ncbi:chemotaxis protein CheW [bacterium]|nr:chemotaxis protein CheW [bacterium]